MPETTSQIIQQLVAPAVMISAAGLLCLALFNRLSTVLARVRAFAVERTSLLRAAGTPGPSLADNALTRVRLEALEAQASSLLRRARYIRNALMLLISGVLCQLACSLLIGLSLLTAWSATAALASFVLGVLATAGAMVCVLAELRRSLDDARSEHRVLEEMQTPMG